jgi:hypothetical protein
MSTRATPETDEAAVLPRPMAYADGFVILRHLARKLENERDEAREERDALKADKDLIAGQLFAARGMYEDRDIIAAERDAALAKLAKCREALENIAGCAETNARANSDSDETIALNHIADTAGETLDATTPELQICSPNP